MGILTGVLSNILLVLFIILMGCFILLMFQFGRVKTFLRKYPDIKEKILSRYRHLRGNKIIRKIIMSKNSMGVHVFMGFYSIRSFNRTFNNIYHYYDILKIRDKDFIKTIDNFRITNFIFYVVFMTYACIIIGIVIITLILFIISLIYNGNSIFGCLIRL